MPVGRPKKSKSNPQYLNGSTGKSSEEHFKVSPDPKLLIPFIEDDYRRISKDNTRKMSLKTLKYLKDKGFVKHHHFFMYSQVSERPEDRTLIPERSVVEIVNAKLIHLYESC